MLMEIPSSLPADLIHTGEQLGCSDSCHSSIPLVLYQTAHMRIQIQSDLSDNGMLKVKWISSVSSVESVVSDETDDDMISSKVTK